MRYSLLKYLFLLLIVGCTSDIALHEQKKDHVVVDSFIQPYQVTQLDVLVVVDTSGSMNDNFESVGTGMDALRIDIENLTLDYQFGFITTDANNLSFVGPYTSSSSAIDVMLAPSLLASAAGEAGFESTYTFYNDEISSSFFRENSDFLLFLISDEDEQSSISASIFQEWLYSIAIFDRHDVVSITTLEDNSNCSYSWDIGYKYTELANLYNKDSIDICSDGWEVWLSDSSFLTQLKNYIELSQAPISDSIVVYVNQTVTHDWTYNSDQNTVHLGFTPDYGALVEVGYEVES